MDIAHITRERRRLLTLAQSALDDDHRDDLFARAEEPVLISTTPETTVTSTVSFEVQRLRYSASGAEVWLPVLSTPRAAYAHEIRDGRTRPERPHRVIMVETILARTVNPAETPLYAVAAGA